VPTAQIKPPGTPPVSSREGRPSGR
jgi:hypothetical protein